MYNEKQKKNPGKALDKKVGCVYNTGDL